MKRLAHRLRRTPVSLRIPLIVAGLVVLVSLAISERVLARLAQLQQASLTGVAQTYLDGLSAAVIEPVLRDDVWEVFAAIDARRSTGEGPVPLDTVVAGQGGRVIAASDPTAFPTDTPVPAEFVETSKASGVVIDPDTLIAYAAQDLSYRGRIIGAIYARFDVGPLFTERRRVLATLLLTNGLLTAGFAALGFTVVRRMIRPLGTLEAHMGSAAQGMLKLIPEAQIPRDNVEVAQLFDSFNALVISENARTELTERLAEEERMASLGRLASGMAHEINNPLGGLMNAVDTLKTHGASPVVRQESTALIQRGLEGIQDVVAATLATYRPPAALRALTLEDLMDLKLLVAPELRRRGQTLDCDLSSFSKAAGLSAPGGPVRQALLNLLLNASSATPAGGTIRLRAGEKGDTLWLEVADEGPGLPEASAQVLVGERTARVGEAGLGLWLVRRIFKDLGARAEIARRPEGGTVIRMVLPLNREEAHATG